MIKIANRTLFIITLSVASFLFVWSSAGFAQVGSGEILTRSLLILNEYPSLNVSVALKAGEAFGTTDIAVDVKEGKRLSGDVVYDNFGSKTTSKQRITLAFNTAPLIINGELLALKLITRLDPFDLNRFSYARAEYLFPINYNGTKVGLSYANSRYEAGGLFAGFNINGRADVATLYVTHPNWRRRAALLHGEIYFPTGLGGA
jgi:hemolysin activation/secretion protein